MLRRFGAVLALALLTTGATAGAAAAWEPDPGAHFNNPWGKTSSKERLVKTFIAAVNHAHKGSTIKIAAYSNDRKDIADALIYAHNRGVNVQMLLNDNFTSQQTKRHPAQARLRHLQASFLRICKSSCRGKRGNLHSKFYLFSAPARRTYIAMMGSANLTGYGVKIQWNDMYTTTPTSRCTTLYAKIFEQMKRDRALAHPYRHHHGARVLRHELLPEVRHHREQRPDHVAAQQGALRRRHRRHRCRRTRR